MKDNNSLRGQWTILVMLTYLYYFAEHYCCLQFISIYNNIQDNKQKLQNFLKITNSGAAT